MSNLTPTVFYKQGHDAALYQLGLYKEAALLDIPSLWQRAFMPIEKYLDRRAIRELVKELQQSKIQPSQYPGIMSVTPPTRGLFLKRPAETRLISQEGINELLSMSPKA